MAISLDMLHSQFGVLAKSCKIRIKAQYCAGDVHETILWDLHRAICISCIYAICILCHCSVNFYESSQLTDIN